LDQIRQLDKQIKVLQQVKDRFEDELKKQFFDESKTPTVDTQQVKEPEVKKDVPLYDENALKLNQSINNLSVNSSKTIKVKDGKKFEYIEEFLGDPSQSKKYISSEDPEID